MPAGLDVTLPPGAPNPDFVTVNFLPKVIRTWESIPEFLPRCTESILATANLSAALEEESIVVTVTEAVG